MGMPSKRARRVIARFLLGWPIVAIMRGGGVYAIGMAAYVTGFFTTSDEAARDFFDAAAQIIPVLMLVLAVEARIFRLSPITFPEYRPYEPSIDRFERYLNEAQTTVIEPFARRLYGAPLLLAIAAGEVFAVIRLLDDGATGGHARPVFAAIVAALAMIVVLALTPAVRPGQRPGGGAPDVTPEHADDPPEPRLAA